MYQVIWMYDGCPGKAASPKMSTVDACKTFIRVHMRMYPGKFVDHKVSLDIVDLTTERLISYVL